MPDIYLKNRKELIKKVEDYFGYVCCEMCGRSGDTRLETHHIVFKSEKPNHEQINNIENLILLCSQCHKDFHDKKYLRNGIIKKRGLDKLFGKDVLDK